MRLRTGYVVLLVAFGIGFSGCSGGSEPTEAQMKDAMLQEMNHPTGAPAGDPVRITFFKKGACDNPTPQGYECSFTVNVASSNIGASMYNNVPQGFFYVDKETGKWAMRPPF